MFFVNMKPRLHVVVLQSNVARYRGYKHRRTLGSLKSNIIFCEDFASLLTTKNVTEQDVVVVVVVVVVVFERVVSCAAKSAANVDAGPCGTR